MFFFFQFLHLTFEMKDKYYIFKNSVGIHYYVLYM
jgi:hypothetical protein